MTPSPNYSELDDRARDADLDRLRDAAAHVIDVVRRLVRVELAAGAHPMDAVIHGLSMLQWWETGMELDPALSPEAYARVVEATLTRLHARVGAEPMWQWLRQPQDSLHGDTPLRALVGHNERGVGRLIDAMPPAPTSTGERRGSPDV